MSELTLGPAAAWEPVSDVAEVRSWRRAPARKAVVMPIRPSATAPIFDSQARVISDALDQLTLRDQILQTLAKTRSDWRSVESLARELDVPATRLRAMVRHMPEVRRPIAASADEGKLVRLASRGLTKREWYRYFGLVLTRRAW